MLIPFKTVHGTDAGREVIWKPAKSTPAGSFIHGTIDSISSAVMRIRIDEETRIALGTESEIIGVDPREVEFLEDDLTATLRLRAPSIPTMTLGFDHIWHYPGLAAGEMPGDEKIDSIAEYLTDMSGVSSGDEIARAVIRLVIIDVYEHELAHHPNEPQRVNTPTTADFMGALQVKHFEEAALQNKARELFQILDSRITASQALATVRGRLIFGGIGSGKTTLLLRTAASMLLHDKSASLIFIGEKGVSDQLLRGLLPKERILGNGYAIEDAIAMRGAQIFGFRSEDERAYAFNLLWRALNFAWSEKLDAPLIVALDAPDQFVPASSADVTLHTMMYALAKSRLMFPLVAFQNLHSIQRVFGENGVRVFMRFEELAILRSHDRQLDQLAHLYTGYGASDIEPGKAIILSRRVETVERLPPFVSVVDELDNMALPGRSDNERLAL